MIDSSALIELEGFERIEAAPGKALLRVRGRGTGAGEPPAVATLLIEVAGQLHRVPPLPSPPDPQGLLRAAFPVPTELLEQATGYALELEKGGQVELQPPTTRPGAAPPSAAPATNRVTELETQLREARAQAATLAAAAEEAETRALTLEQVVRSESERREALEEAVRLAEQRASADTEHVRAKRTATRAALQASQEELRIAQLKLAHQSEAEHAAIEQLEALDRPEPEQRGVSLAQQERLRRQRELSERRDARMRARQAARAERPSPHPPTASAEPEAAQTRAAEPPPSIDEAAEFEFTLNGLRSDEDPMPQAFVERGRSPSWLPSEALIGVCLLVLGLLLAVLIITGAIKL